jgi:hypothetical protein
MPDVFVADKNEAEQQTENKTSDAPYIAKSDTNIKPVTIESSPIPPANRVHLFTSLCKNPDDISFQNQDEGEKPLLFIRKDFVTNTGWILTGIFLIFLPVLFSVTQYSLHISFNLLPERFGLIFLFFYYLLTISYWYINFITWYFNISLITDRRIIDIDFSGLVYKNVSATKLDLVQDVSYTQIGVIRNFFDYGDVLIQTAGTLDNFVFDAAPRPEDIVHVVEGLIGKSHE